MGQLNFHHLRYFHAIVQHGTLTKAAAALNVSPSSLSVQVQQLEAQLGHDLFERRGRVLVLTEAGRIALERAEAIFDAGDELVSALKGMGRGRRTTVRVGALATLSRNFEVAFLAPAMAQADVRIVMRSATMRELLSMLDAHHIDVLLTNTLPVRDETMPWTAHLIASQPVSLVGAPRGRRRKASLGAILSSEPLIVPAVENHIRGEFDALMDRMRLSPRIVAEVDDMALIRLLAREGLGCAVVPPIVVRDELSSGVLHEYGRLPGLRESFYAITPARRFPNPLIQALVAARPAVVAQGARQRRGG